MFHFGSNGRFLALSALDLCSGSVGVLLALRWTTIDFVMNALTRFVCSYRFRALFGSEIAAVSVDNLLLSDQKFCYHAYIVFVGRCHFQCVHNASFVVNSHMDLVPEVPCVALFSRMRLRVTLLVLIFGRRWRFDESWVDNRALLENQVAFRQQSYVYSLCSCYDALFLGGL